VGSGFVFAPSGFIVACTLNTHGSWHDSSVAENGGLYSTLKTVYVYDLTGGKCVVNSVFSLNRCPFLIESGEKKLGESVA
jgi:hypothetical protein